MDALEATQSSASCPRTKGDEDRTSNILIGRQPALPPEQQLKTELKFLSINLSLFITLLYTPARMSYQRS